MTTQQKTTYISTFEKEVAEGLTSFPKKLSSKYFYDKKGDKLFQDIMAMPSYYLTNCEFDIFETHTHAISEAFMSDQGFDLIELGAGDGKKTKILLRHLLRRDAHFTYIPIDISENVLEQLNESIREELPDLIVDPQQGTYFEVLEDIGSYKTRKKVILFLGSNIGNLLHPQAVDFLSNLQRSMNKGDLLFVGFDQKKDPQVILNAYNDSTGITEAFNKNILHRINNELDANFDPDAFKHWEVYDPETGTAKSYLLSTVAQSVTINKLELDVTFNAWESIHTEISQKYDDKTVQWLAQESGLEIIDQFTDHKGYYKNYIFKKS